jgi:hypothetical protein
MPTPMGVGGSATGGPSRHGKGVLAAGTTVSVVEASDGGVAPALFTLGAGAADRLWLRVRDIRDLHEGTERRERAVVARALRGNFWHRGNL